MAEDFQRLRNKTFQSLEGKNAIVTGASRGIGKGIAYDLASRGAKVLVTYNSESSASKVERFATEIGPQIDSVQANLSDHKGPEKVVEAATNFFGEKSIDILVNNAAFLNNGALGEITRDDYDAVFNVNVAGTLFLTQAIRPHLRPAARIINISSVGARMANVGMSLYTASKAALNGLTRVWASELGHDGTTVNAVCPGPVQSDMLDLVPAEIKELQRKETPVEQRFGEDRDIAGVVSWLAEERSRWVTGQVISASGGYAKY
ncbi:NAD(P)-binding protein [Pseudovirgaria hyperparasitica]|uniref:NAD(P)-binding protein n=1 Tax=Pseudovirgaria hyperparasitica TaxID=470096 RepID=A0A6A6W0L6_9PEZI|nr:NAD(P)-binding protein [Pseudovirgaria hyperparasitica]KAF2755679.1 NAD(P)-binding protein [Pseudovirgaria hyperparasitica]